MSYELAKRFNDPLLKPWCGRAAPRALGHAAAGTCLDRRALARLLLLPPSFRPLDRVNANVDAEGYCDERPGLKHPAVRSSGRESEWRPAAANVAPRAAGWRPAPSPAGASSSAQ